MSDGLCFSPSVPLVEGFAPDPCRSCVVIPARNEEDALPSCLDALSRQVHPCGEPVHLDTFEIILLLNNCTDASVTVARRWQGAHPAIALHIAERTLPSHQANVGAARRWLMDTAWWRLGRVAHRPAVILSTDADTVVAADWIASNLRALEAGADVVGGQIALQPQHLAGLPPSVQTCYRQDRRYAALVALLEDLLDPQPGDRWPRHLDHFGSSLGCTPQAYAAAGGMPALPALEDEAFIDRVRRAGLRLRHDLDVRVYTSARLAGRAPRGMSRQLQLWDDLPCRDAHTVPSAAFLAHRFRQMGQLRRIFSTKQVGELALPTAWWRETFQRALEQETTCPGFLGAVYADILIAESFGLQPEEPIAEAVRKLEDLTVALQRPHPAKAGSGESSGPRQREEGPQVGHDTAHSGEMVGSGSESLQ